jgi:hypothetical protein
VNGYNKVVKQIDKTLCRNMRYGSLGKTPAERDGRLMEAFGYQVQDDEEFDSNREIQIHMGKNKGITEVSGIAYLVESDNEKMAEGKHDVSD